MGVKGSGREGSLLTESQIDCIDKQTTAHTTTRLPYTHVDQQSVYNYMYCNTSKAYRSNRYATIGMDEM